MLLYVSTFSLSVGQFGSERLVQQVVAQILETSGHTEGASSATMETSEGQWLCC